MPFIQQHISKGLYQYSQIDRFISVKNYMFVRTDNRKCLMLRFSNDSDYLVDSMDFVIVQMDSNGTVIGRTPVSYKALSFAAGTTYTPNEGIVVDEYCNKFKIQFACVTSGNYKYLVKDGKISVQYEKADKDLPSNPSRRHRIYSFAVKPLKNGKQGLAVFLAIVSLLAVIGLNVHHIYSEYMESIEVETEQDELDTLQQDPLDTSMPMVE